MMTIQMLLDYAVSCQDSVLLIVLGLQINFIKLLFVNSSRFCLLLRLFFFNFFPLVARMPFGKYSFQYLRSY